MRALDLENRRASRSGPRPQSCSEATQGMRFPRAAVAPPCLLLRARRACGTKGEGAGTHLRAALGTGMTAEDRWSPGGPVVRAPDKH
ncbi:hypothetical protein NDU88_006816 [Pleurodeles waltl]|uniref:Uncharacterized protein n=1 Tax=Pleurodeles waltl TaxID=8319 RepID=A0AAV7NU90_PLEWA|nr:hypothetical protein NDU88_006816 [Pleurodeles waltl]